MTNTRKVLFALIVGAGALTMAQPSFAAGCVNGVYRAGCAGPNGAAVVRKYPHYYHGGYGYRGYGYHSGRGVACANGVYRAGCVGPHGAVGVRKY